MKVPFVLLFFLCGLVIPGGLANDVPTLVAAATSRHEAASVARAGSTGAVDADVPSAVSRTAAGYAAAA